MNAFQKLNAEFGRRCPWGPSVEGWKEAAGRAGKNPEATAKFKSLQAKFRDDCAAFAKDLNAQIDALLPKLSAQAKALIGDRPKLGEGMFESAKEGNKGYTQALQVFHNRCSLAVAAGPAPVAPAPKPAAPALTAESIGAACIATATSQDKTVREASKKAVGVIAAGAKLLARSDFDLLTVAEKTAFMRAGGRLFDTPKSKVKAEPKSNWKPPAPPTMNRAAFNELSQSARAAFFKDGGILTNI